jgi:hypothetical protein
VAINSAIRTPSVSARLCTPAAYRRLPPPTATKAQLSGAATQLLRIACIFFSIATTINSCCGVGLNCTNSQPAAAFAV